MVCLCGSAPAQTVAIINHGAGTNTDFFVGDAWELDFTGTTGDEIGVNGLDTGLTIGPSGTTQRTGSIPEGSEGPNEQYWTVGGVPASPYPLVFTVEAAPNGSCSAVAEIEGSGGTLQSTDTLNRFQGSVSTATSPSSLDVTITDNLATCNLSQYSTQGNDYPEFLYAQSISTGGTVAEFSIQDAGCRYGQAEQRSCDWSWRTQYPQNDYDYPIFNSLYVSATFYDRYFHQYFTASTIVYLWVNFVWG